MTVKHRGTSNSNERGSAEQRRQRKRWLFEQWAADVDVVAWNEFDDLFEAIRETGLLLPYTVERGNLIAVTKGLGRPAVRCFRCGKLLDWESVECDRIIPAAQKSKKYPMGGRYQKNNIRPCCEGCNKKISGEEKRRSNAKRKATNARKRAARAATKAHLEKERARCRDLSGAIL